MVEKATFELAASKGWRVSLRLPVVLPLEGTVNVCDANGRVILKPRNEVVDHVARSHSPSPWQDGLGKG